MFKLTNRNKKIIATLILVAFIGLLFVRSRAAEPSPSGSSNGGFTVYGTDWCGFTTKQRKQLDEKYGKDSHTYVNCEKNKSACKGMDGFPVTHTPDGEKVVGFNPDL